MQYTTYTLKLLAIALLAPALTWAAEVPGDGKPAPSGEKPAAGKDEPASEGGEEGAVVLRQARARAAALTQEGMEQVRRFNNDQVHNATAIVDAAISFGKARAQLMAAGADADAIAEVQANLYWCKKQMNLDALKEYVAQKGADFQVASKQMEAVAAVKPAASEAAAYLDRADRYAKANPEDYLQIAIRFTEVAERFPGQPEGTEANKRSTAAIQAQMKALQDAQQAARQTRFTKPNTVIAGATPVPSAAEQKEGQAQVRKAYAKAFAKRDNPAKARLARKLLEETAKNRADPIIFHQMVSEAIRLAVESEAYEPLLDGIELLAGTFAGIDANAERQAALKKMSGKPVALAIAKLLTTPADPAANVTAGKWFCFTARRWPAGLPMLALGNDADLAKVAAMELAAPQASSEVLQVADAWYDAGGKARSKDDKVGMQGRAMFWYLQVLPQLNGLGKDRVAKRIAEIEKLLPLDLDNVDWNALTATQWDKLKGRMVTVNARVDRFDPGISLAAGETVRVVPHPTEEWTIVIDSWFDEGKKAACGWRGYRRKSTYYSFREDAGYSNPGALMVWIETGEKQNAGIIKGPGRVYFSPYIESWTVGDRTGTIRVKLVAVTEDE